MAFDSILETIGNTPLVQARKISQNAKVSLYLKLEGHNPGGSVKDRAAYSMIQSALHRGEISNSTHLIEATSGNTGIALAMIARSFGIQITLVMPENATKERMQIMKAYGATVVRTPESKGMEAARDFVLSQVQKSNYLSLNQFENPDNWKAHYRTTGPEIWKDSKGKVTHFVSAMGTTGTIMGTSTFLKQQSQAIQIVGVQPSDGSRIPGIRKWPKAYLPKIFDPQKVDQIIEISEKEAAQMAIRLAQEEAIFSGMSSGGAVAAALKLSKTLTSGVIVAIICDRGDRYLSSSLFS